MASAEDACRSTFAVFGPMALLRAAIAEPGAVGSLAPDRDVSWGPAAVATRILYTATYAAAYPADSLVAEFYFLRREIVGKCDDRRQCTCIGCGAIGQRLARVQGCSAACQGLSEPLLRWCSRPGP
ncbi:hypothetical protein TKK_0012225 [Trichogramma kaykai]